MSDDLISRLAAGLEPASRARVPVRLALAIAAGGAVTLVVVLAILGPRPDLATAVGGLMFWIKLAYALGLGLAGVACLERLSRPAGDARGRAPWLAAPAIVMAVVAVGQLLPASPYERLSLLMGGSASVCPFLIVACAVPIFAALVWSLRRLAPTNLRLAGAAAGLTAGAWGAAIYALHCDEAGGAFVLVWYSLGMLIACAVGALLGPRILRWR